jgi:hypothetical protein
MSSLPVYGANNAWSQFNQPLLPIGNDYSFPSHSQPQSSYPYQQYLQSSVNPGDTPTQSNHQYSSPTSVGQPSPQIEQPYYAQPSLPAFSPTSPTFIGQPFDLGHPNAIYQSPPQSTPLSLSDALSPEAPPFTYVPTVTRPQDQYYPTSILHTKRSREFDQSGDQDNGVDDDPPTDAKDSAAKPKLSVPPSRFPDSHR